MMFSGKVICLRVRSWRRFVVLDKFESGTRTEFFKAMGYSEREVVFVLREQETVGVPTVSFDIHDLNFGYLRLIQFVIFIKQEFADRVKRKSLATRRRD